MLYAGFLEIHRAIEEIQRVADVIGAEVMIYRLGSARLEGERGRHPMDPFHVLDEILRSAQSQTERRHRLWVLLYFHLLLKDPNGILLAKLREIVDQGSLHDTVIVVGPPSFPLPEELSDIPFLHASPPSPGEIRSWLNVEEADEKKRRVERACFGLSYREVEDLFSLSIARHGFIDAQCVERESLRRRRQKTGGMVHMEYPQMTLDDVGGYEALKDWLKVRGEVFLSNEGRPTVRPKGMLLLGVPGCGKSLVCNALAGSWGIPLLVLDPSRLYASSLGATERNLRTAIELAESASPCVLWMDEVEKGFAVTDPRTDGGVGNRLLGAVLSFLQERSARVFVVGTGNDIQMLPQEFLRKGRWDEIFFLDLPQKEERKSILKKILRRHGIHAAVSEPMLALSENFSGAELEQAVLDAIVASQGRGERIGQWEILQAIRRIIPFANALGSEMDALRSWARRHARWASRSPVTNQSATAVCLDPKRTIHEPTFSPETPRGNPGPG
jgi:SpoVK/Ycf46/Vps4 family AAA+-type ATPase